MVGGTMGTQRRIGDFFAVLITFLCPGLLMIVEISALDSVFIHTLRAIVSRVPAYRSEEHTSELQSLMRIAYAVFCLKKTEHAELQYRRHLSIDAVHTDLNTPPLHTNTKN